APPARTPPPTNNNRVRNFTMTTPLNNCSEKCKCRAGPWPDPAPVASALASNSRSADNTSSSWWVTATVAAGRLSVSVGLSGPRFVLLRRFLVGAVLAYVGTSLTLGGTRPAKAVVYLLAAAWAVVLWLRPLPPRWRGRLGGRFEILVTNVVLTLVLAELGLRAYAACGGPSLLVNTTLDAHLLTPGRDYGAGLRGNALGSPGNDFRREKQPGVGRIVALGDSFAVGPAVPFDDNYLTLLEKSLPAVEVYNFGISGAGPREYLAVLRRDGFAHHPDLVLVSVFVGNDITEVLPAPRYLDPRQHSLFLLLERGWRLARESRRQASEGEGNATERLQAPALSRQTFREVEARRLSVCLVPPTSGMERKWRRALADLERLVTECRRQGVKVA